MLKLHAQDKTKPPIILFPEGTCINNTSVMIFRKGSFEIANCIYPVAIKVKIFIVLKKIIVSINVWRCILE